MHRTADIASRALSAARSEPRVGPHFKPRLLEIDATGTAIVEAEVESVAVKRLVLERIAARARRAGRTARCRSAGCASGEEPYTIRILWDLDTAKRFPGGCLVIGARERLPAPATALVPAWELPHIFVLPGGSEH